MGNGVYSGAVFLAGGAFLLWIGIERSDSCVGFLWLSSGVAFMALGGCYVFCLPRLLGKRKNGKLLLLSYVFFWPHHMLSYASLAIFRLMRVKAYSEIVPGLYLGGRLFPCETAGLRVAGVASVLDLTCEFGESKPLRQVPAYFCIPLLDGTAPSSAQLEAGIRFIEERLWSGPVYVHCAVGHGRSATFAIGYLLSTGRLGGLTSTLKYVQSKRPGVRLNFAQMSVLESLGSMSEEIFDIVNERDEVVGSRSRSEVHRLGLLHRAVHVLVYNAAGQLFLQKRSLKKDRQPGVWDSSASGHVDSGEDYDVCALRELHEEIGLEPAASPRRLFKLAASAETDKEHVWVYRCEAEGPFTLNSEEIDEGAWYNPAEIDRWMREKPGEFASAFVVIWKRMISHRL